MLRGAIFDLDGTLLASMPLWNSFGARYLKALGKEPHEDLTETFRTFTLEQAAVYYQTHYDIALSVEEIVSGANRMIEQYYRSEVQLKSGAAEFLQELTEQGMKLCIATVTDRSLTEMSLERLGVRHFFVKIFTAAELGCDKTTPALYRAAQRYLNTEKAETVIFEDAYHAVRTAREDRFPTVAVFDGSEPQQEELRRIADCYLADLEHTEAFWKFASAM